MYYYYRYKSRWCMLCVFHELPTYEWRWPKNPFSLGDLPDPRLHGASARGAAAHVRPLVKRPRVCQRLVAPPWAPGRRPGQTVCSRSDLHQPHALWPPQVNVMNVTARAVVFTPGRLLGRVKDWGMWSETRSVFILIKVYLLFKQAVFFRNGSLKQGVSPVRFSNQMK